MTTTINLSLDDLKGLLSTPPAITPTGSHSRYVVVRGDRSGVFCGILVSEEGRTVELTDCRHIWYWAGAANTAELAQSGTSKPGDCKFVAPVKRLRVLDAITIIDCTPKAEASLRAVPIWSKQ